MQAEEHYSSYRWIILLVIWITTFFISGSWLFIISIIDTIEFGIFNFGLSTGEGALIVIFPIVSLIPLSFLGGPIVDRIGVKKIGVIGMLIFTIFSALRGISDDFLTLAIFTVCMGAGLGLTNTLSSKLIGFWFKGSEIGTASGIAVMASGFGIFFFEAISLPIILPLVGNWGNMFLFFGTLTAIGLIIWILLVKDFPKDFSEQIVERAPIRESISSIIKNKKVWNVVIINIALAVSYFAGKNAFRLLFPLRTGENSIVHQLIRLKYPFVKLGEPHITMFLISIISLGALVSNLTIPYWSDRVGKRKMFLISGLAIMGISIILNSIFIGALLWIFSFIFGFAVGMLAPLLPTCIIELVEAKHIGTGVGLVYSMGYTCVLIVTFLFPFLIPDKYNLLSYLPLLIGFGIFCLIAVIFAQKLPETAGKMKSIH